MNNSTDKVPKPAINTTLEQGRTSSVESAFLTTSEQARECSSR